MAKKQYKKYDLGHITAGRDLSTIKPGGGGGGGQGQGSPSILQRTMDIISRGNYAMAEGSRRAAFTSKSDPSKVNMVGSPMGFLKGFGAGISGKKKTTFSDVLKQGGMGKNPGRAGLGFAADILLDPTTYLTFGVGGVAKTAARTGGKVVVGKQIAKQAAKQAKQAAKKSDQLVSTGARVVQEAQKIAQKAAPPGQARRVSGFADDAGVPFAHKVNGDTVTSRLFKQSDTAPARIPIPVGKGVAPAAGRELSTQFAAPYARAAGRAGDAAGITTKAGKATQGAAKAAEAAAPTAAKVGAAVPEGAAMKRALELRFAGIPLIKSEKAYQAGKALNMGMKGSQAGKLLGETFNVGHGLDKETANLQRIYAGQGRQASDDFAREVHDVYTKLHVSKEGQKEIRSAIQEGTVKDLPPQLIEAARWTQGKLDELESMKTGSKTGKKLDDVRFEDMKPFKGATDHYTYRKAPQNLVAEYDRVLRKRSYDDFIKEIDKRFPDIKKNQEVQAALKKSKEIFGVDGEVSAAWQHHMNRVQAPWKRWVTVYRPGFHIRNMLGDSFNAYLAGTRPKWFEKSAKFLAKSDSDSVIMAAGRPFTHAEWDRMYRKGGLETSQIEAEMLGGTGTKLSRAVTDVSQKREKYTRMATFMDSMDKALKQGKSVDKAIEEASFRVRKYHFDYTALTPQERKMRSFIPFYTYTRKELPLLLEHTLRTPGKMAAVPKATSALSQVMGVEHDPDDPFPGLDLMMPEYLKDQNIVQMGNNKVMAPGLPADMMSQFNPAEFVRQQAQGLSPLLQAPYELASGENIGGGKQNQALWRYAAGHLPYGTMARDSDAPLSERMKNILHGLGIKKLQDK